MVNAAKTPASMPFHWKIGIGFGIGLLLGLLVHMLSPGAPWVHLVTSYCSSI
jgi:DAACS family dicarboxylate/amino acid:cation (Na+ or H+) symporter